MGIVSLLIGQAARLAWRAPAFVLAVAGCLALAACGGFDMTGMFGDSRPQQPQPQQPPMAGAIRVALLLPLSAQGEIAPIAASMKQAAEMAMFDAGNPGITLITKDTGGTAAGAQLAAEAAVAEGVELIIGPLFASEVQAVSPVARRAGVPVVAFSNISGVAGPGIYLMSFLPEEEVANIVRYAAQTGLRSIGAFLPRTSYGNSVEKVLVTSAQVYGARVVAIERYERSQDGMVGPAGRLAGRVASGMQALLVPEGGEVLRMAGTALASAGITPSSLRILGTGLWDDTLTPSTPIAIAGWYAGVAPELVTRFAQRFQRSHGTSPPRIASLAYDAVSLAIILGRGPAGARYGASQITNPQGFQGANGLFRFNQAGLCERGLSILEMTPAGPRIVAPAPQRFGIGF